MKSLDRIITRQCRWGIREFNWKGRILSLVMHHTGYLISSLGKCTKMHRVHQLVAWAFIGPQEIGMTVNHVDGNKLNNRVENLEYISSRDNVLHAYRTGLLSNCGETNGKAVLNDKMVAEILSFPKTVTAADVASAVGCKKHSVVQVRSGRSWKHVPRPILT